MKQAAAELERRSRLVPPPCSLVVDQSQRPLDAMPAILPRHSPRQQAGETRLFVSGACSGGTEFCHDKSWIYRSHHAAAVLTRGALPSLEQIPVPRRQERDPLDQPALPHIEATRASRETTLRHAPVEKEQGRTRGLPPIDSASEHDEHAELRARVWAKMQADGESLETLLPILRKVGIFRKLSDPELLTLYRRASHRAFPRYAAVLHRGSVGRGYYVLLSGTVECKSALGVTEILQAGASMGEEVLADSGLRREASVTAVTVCYFLRFDPSDLHGLPVDLAALQDTRLAAVLLEGAQRLQVFCRTLEAVAWLNKLPGDVLEKVAALFDEVLQFRPGEVVFEEGETERVLYVMVEGRVELRKGKGTSPQAGLLANQGQAGVVPTPLGSCQTPWFVRLAESQTPWFGEAAMVQHDFSRTETATCPAPTKLLPLRARRFAAFLELVPTFPLPVMMIVAARKPSYSLETPDAASRRELAQANRAHRKLRRASREMLKSEARAARGAKMSSSNVLMNDERVRGISGMR